MAEKKSSNPTKSGKVSNSSENSKESFKRLEIILCVIYATLITLILLTLADQSVGPHAKKHVFSIKFISLFLIGAIAARIVLNFIILEINSGIIDSKVINSFFLGYHL